MNETMVDRQGSYAGNTGDPVIPTCAPEAAVAGACTSSCTAVAIREDSSIAYARRALHSLKEARLIANGYEEGAYNALYAMGQRLGFYDPHSFAIERGPTYGQIRGFLIGDCDIDERIAQRVAFDIIARRNRLRTRHAHAWSNGEVGWI